MTIIIVLLLLMLALLSILEVSFTSLNIIRIKSVLFLNYFLNKNYLFLIFD